MTCITYTPGEKNKTENLLNNSFRCSQHSRHCKLSNDSDILNCHISERFFFSVFGEIKEINPGSAVIAVHNLDKNDDIIQCSQLNEMQPTFVE